MGNSIRLSAWLADEGPAEGDKVAAEDVAAPGGEGIVCEMIIGVNKDGITDGLLLPHL